MNNPNIIVETSYGKIIVNNNDYIGKEIIKTGYWEIDDIRLVEIIILELMKKKTGRDFHFYDIGANIGTYSLAIGNLDSRLKVTAFEAQAQIYYMLCGTVAINGLRNVVCKNAAVSESVGEILEIRIPDYTKDGSFGSVELIKPIYSDNQKFLFTNTEKINTLTIDSLSGDIDFIKIDVEGMEDKVLKGGREKIAAHRPVVYVEIYKTDRNFVISFFRDLDYVLYIDESTFNLIAFPRELGFGLTNSKWKLLPDNYF